MKKVLLGLLALTALNSYSQTSPDIECQEESGFTYKFYIDNGEIEVYDETAALIETLEGVYLDIKYLETFPLQNKYEFRYKDGGNLIASITFIHESKTGGGEFVDHDQKMTCRLK